MDTVKSKLETLCEDSQGKVNYASWRLKLNLVLKTKDVYEVAIGTKVKPAGASTDETVKAWVKQDLEAQTLIALNVSSQIASKLAHCATSRQMLDKIINLYGTKTEVTRETLRQKFFSFVYDETKSAAENCMDITAIAEELANDIDPIRPSWVISRILGVLPPKLAHFRTAWDNVDAGQQTVERLVERLRLEDERLKENGNGHETSNQNALVTKHHNKNGQQPTSKREAKSKICFKCEKKGHFVRECKGKPTPKYLEYCKRNYACNKCGKKGHFKNECRSRSSEQSNQPPLALLNTSHDTNSLLSSNSVSKDECWFQDCGASQHMSSHREWFTDMVELDKPVPILIGDGTQLAGAAVGNVKLEAYDGQKWKEVVLKNVLYVPSLGFNLVSVGQILDKGFQQKADHKTSKFVNPRTNEVAVMAEREGNLFKMLLRREKKVECTFITSIRTWHERLAHQNIKYVKNILKSQNVKYVDDWDGTNCTGCDYGKHHRTSHPANPKKAKQPLDLVHVDMGEMDVPSLGNAKYFLLFKDDYTHYRTIYFMKSKDEAPSKLEKYINLVENQLGRKIKKLRSDNGTEIRNAQTRKMVEERGIFHTVTNTHTPEQNGRIEREMRTIVEATRTAIHSNGLDKRLWAEAANYAVFTINQTGTSSVEGKTPAQLWFGRQVDISKLRAFGCECYVLKPSHKRGKMDRKSEKGIMIGYEWDSPCYRIYIPSTGKIVSSDNVIFHEAKPEARPRTELSYSSPQEVTVEEKEEEEETEQAESESDEDGQHEKPKERGNQTPPANQTPRRELRDRNTLKQPKRYADYITDFLGRGNIAQCALIGEVGEIAVEDALKDPDWRKAMQEEYDSLMRMKTWKLEECPKDVKPLSCRWVLREKANGKLKARLVARGFEQKEGIDYAETFSPVARHASIRLILSHAATEKMKLVAFDVKTAFLYGKLTEVLHMTQPQGFEDGSEKVCRLLKAIYGLKQAPRVWNEEVSGKFEELGLKSTDDDPCVYYNQDRSILMTLFVDDGLIAGEDVAEIYKLLKKISQIFEITYSETVQEEFSYLGMELKVKTDGISVSQPRYTMKMLEKMQHADCNPVSTPIDIGAAKEVMEKPNVEATATKAPYREAIGSLLYLATISRPDISFVVNLLSRFCAQPNDTHWNMVKRVFKYLRGTMNSGIFFNGDDKIEAYSDSDFGGDRETMQSTTGVLLMRGGPLVWYSQKQRLVATSTAEAEYRAAVSAIDDVCWIRRITRELKILKTDEPTDLYVDNRSAIYMLKNAHEGKTNKGKKHIEIPRKYIQQHIDKTVSPKPIRSEQQLADIFTKPLSKKIFVNLRSELIQEEC